MVDNYYLRVEAVNLDHFVYDTDKIQPMRGGSYLLLESVHELAGKQFNGFTLNKIATGASIGLFSFGINEADLEKETTMAAKVAADVRKALSDKTKGYATFAVDMIKSTGDFRRDNETITAMNRWRQFQQPTLVLPEKEADNKCAFDGIRPGTTSAREDFISDSVFFRKEEGKKLRSSIYKRILEREFEKDFADDLDKLSYDSAKSNLSGKIALIYLDGNKFTKIRSETCATAEKLSEFSSNIQNHQKQFLNAILLKAIKDNDFKTSSGDIRLELLLWGGDEIELVVPAWNGWEVLQLFYDSVKSATFDGYNLTYAGGILFSNHKATIRQLRRMVREIANMTKESLAGDIKSFKHSTHNCAHYLVLESFDTVGSKMADFVQRYYGKDVFNNLRFTPDLLAGVTETIKLMKSRGFPRNKIFEIIHNIRTVSDDEKLHKKVDNILSEVDDQDTVCNAIEAVTTVVAQHWYMLADLWDYVEVSHD